jgi:hypothetical protein
VAWRAAIFQRASSLWYPRFSDDIRFAEAGDVDRRRKADIKSSCDAATCHQRDDHRIDGYQSSS